MKENFETCIDFILGVEGGYVDHPEDPGGATNFGITQITLAHYRGEPVAKEDVQNLTRDEARDIYRALYWDACKADELRPGVDLVVFGSAVHSGVAQAVKWLQRAAGTPADGIIGPKTLKACRAVPAHTLIDQIIDRRFHFLRGLKGWDTFGRGWTTRMEKLALRASQLSQEKPKTIDQVKEPVNVKAAGVAVAGAGAVANEVADVGEAVSVVEENLPLIERVMQNENLVALFGVLAVGVAIWWIYTNYWNKR